MGIGFQIIFAVMFLGTVLAVGGSIYALLVVMSRRNPHIEIMRQALVRAAAAIAVVLGIGIVLGFADIAMEIFVPSHLFAKTFGFSPTPDITDSPTPDITDLKGYRSGILGDGSLTKLEFRAAPKTVERIVRENRLLELPNRSTSIFSEQDLDEAHIDANARRFHSSSERNSESMYLIHDEIEGKVYFNQTGF